MPFIIILLVLAMLVSKNSEFKGRGHYPKMTNDVRITTPFIFRERKVLKQVENVKTITRLDP